MISMPLSRLAATAPAWTDCQNRCALPFGITAMTSFFSRLQADNASRHTARVSLRASSFFMGASSILENSAGSKPAAGQRPAPLFADHAAGDAGAGVACRVRLHVVGLFMNHERGSTIGEDGVIAIAHVDAGVGDGRLGLTLGVDGEVGHITGVMSFGIVQAMFLPLGIKVRTGGGEFGGLAFGVLMDMDRVLAR